MVHDTKIAKFAGTMEELAEDIGNLRYDALAEFLELLAAKIEKDGAKDASRGRVQLAGRLQACTESLREGKMAIDTAWKICKPYME